MIYGIGSGGPGPLDARQGMLISPPNFPGWPSMPIRRIVQERTGFPVFIDNDANAAALAEKWFGAAREMESFAYILIEDGVGGGIFVGGDIYRGEHDVAGEVGHMSVNFSGTNLRLWGMSAAWNCMPRRAWWKIMPARRLPAGRSRACLTWWTGKWIASPLS
jgi:predicted NBD/HSP70 family sugar kinase